MKERLFSGIRPSGTLHIGNYLGAIRNWVDLQDRYDCIFSIVDYHAITTKYDTKKLAGLTFDMAVDIIASGVDPKKSVLFPQSRVSEHTEMAWVLSSVTPMGDLSRMTQFKEKSESMKTVNSGLFIYPVLMAADILLYGAEHVPVGDDQLQHLELTREIARRFNHQYDASVLKEPRSVLTPTPRIMGLDGKKKMSKSLDNCIFIRDSRDEIMKKLRPAFTDENRKRLSDPGNPDICNIFSMHQGFTPQDKIDDIDGKCRSASIGCGDCKKILCDHMADHLEPIQARIRELESEPSLIEEIFDAGTTAAKSIASDRMSKVRKMLGMYNKQ